MIHQLTPFALVLLGLSAYRINRLAVIDTFPPVAALRRAWFQHWPKAGFVSQKYPSRWKKKGWSFARVSDDGWAATQGTTLGYLLSCTWCFGFWVGLLHWVAFELWPNGTLAFASPWAIAAICSLVYNFER